MKVKKLFIYLYLLTVLPVSAAYFDIEWSEFCPQEFLNLENKTYILPDKVYWVQRKIEFENKKQICLSQQNKEDCFNELRQYESNKNKLYFQEKDLQQQRERSEMLYDSIESLRYRDY